MSSLIRLAVVLTGAALVVSCSSSGGDSSSGSQIQFDEGGTSFLAEQRTYILAPSGGGQNGADVVSWRWSDQPVNAGALSQCADEAQGFDVQRAAVRLQAACTDASQCQLAFDQLSTDSEAGIARFAISVPELRAPVGLTYQLEAEDSLGNRTVSNITFCLVSVNEAPEAVDDVFTVTEGEPLIVSASEGINLLSNDSDDEDVGNSPLSVNTVPITSPQLSTSFTLLADGGFRYEYTGDPIVEGGQRLVDSFSYEISDGVHTSTATVTLNIVTVDNPPSQNADIPEVTFIAGVESEFDLQPYFTDPEGSELLFLAVDPPVVPSAELVISPTGLVSGEALASDQGSRLVNISVSDGVSSITGTFRLVVTANSPPTVQSVADINVEFGELINLDASAWFFDPEFAQLSYSLSTSPASGLSINAATGVVTGQLSIAGDYAVTVSASDGINPAVSVSFTITQGEQPNRAPIFTGTAVDDQSIVIGNAMTTVAPEFADPDDDTLSYTINVLPAGLSFSTTSGVLSGTPDATGSYSLVITAADPEAATASTNTFTLVVDEVPNQPPTVSGGLTNQVIVLGASIAPVTPNFNDPEGEQLTFTATGLPTGLSLNSSGTVSGTPTTAGTSTIVVTATDPGGLSVSAPAFQITVNTPANQAPEFDGPTIGNQVLVLGNAISAVPANFSDPEGDDLTYDATGLPTGVSQSPATGALTGTPTVAGVYTVTLTAEDPDGLSADSNTFTITVNTPANQAPEFDGPVIVDQILDLGDPISPVAANFSDPEGDDLSFSATGLPPGVGQSPVTGALTGTPTAAGSYDVTLTAEDPDGLSADSNEFTITVQAVNQAPEFDGPVIADQSLDLGELITPVPANFSDPDGDDLTFSATGLPAGVTQSPVDGSLSGEPTVAGVYDVTLTAEDPDGLSVDSNTFEIEVLEVVVNAAPVFTGPAPAQDVEVSEDIVAIDAADYFSDADGDALTYEISALPTGLSFSPAGVLTGAFGTAGTYGLTITASDSLESTVSDVFSFTVIDQTV